MNPPPLLWCHRYATFAAALGALSSLVVAVRPAVAAVHAPIVESGLTVNATIPRSEGILTMTVSNAPVQLSLVLFSGDKKTLEWTGQLPPVTVDDDRYQSQPGWSLSGQVGDFGGGGPTFSGSYLGWTPVVVAQNAAHDVAAGPAVSPGTRPGLRGGGSLAIAGASDGAGTTVLGATLDLKVPASTSIGSQSATLTVTLLEHS
jgi:hypothetical protein